MHSVPNSLDIFTSFNNCSIKHVTFSLKIFQRSSCLSIHTQEQPLKRFGVKKLSLLLPCLLAPCQSLAPHQTVSSLSSFPQSWGTAVGSSWEAKLLFHPPPQMFSLQDTRSHLLNKTMLPMTELYHSDQMCENS